MAYKKVLSVKELLALIEEHKDDPVFRTNRKGEQTLNPWLKTLRYGQALQVAEGILKKPINPGEFKACWNRTRPPRPKPTTSEPPNTATFGGYRLGQRSALNRDKKMLPRKKKK